MIEKLALLLPIVFLRFESTMKICLFYYKTRVFITLLLSNIHTRFESGNQLINTTVIIY